MRITIPKNDDEAREVADQAYLSGWALAGYVAARVTLDGDHTRKDLMMATSSHHQMSPRDFAAKGFRGLKSKDTVRLYAERWRDHMGAPPRVGQAVDIPDNLEWPPVPTGIGKSKSEASKTRSEAIQKQAAKDGVGASKAVDIASNPKAMKAAIKADPATARAASEALGQAKMEAEDPTFPDRHAKAIRDAALETADADAAIERITRRRNLATVELWLKEWGRAGDIEALDLVGLMLDDVRGNIAKQADALTPEMFTEEEDQQ